jgi:conjugative relaxase-like TrwC/TraI family protein
LLTQRLKANRRVFYDFTLSPPKSVSIVALVAGDGRVERAHERATVSALRELEKFAAARVRKNGASTYRNRRNNAPRSSDGQLKRQFPFAGVRFGQRAEAATE